LPASSSRLFDLRLWNLLLFAGIAVFCFRYAKPLAWSAGALPDYLVGDFPKSDEGALLDQAMAVMNAGGNPAQSSALLEEVREIEPFSYLFFLAESYQREGRKGEALAVYRRVIQLDPLYAPAYDRVAALLAVPSRERERTALLDEALRRFRKYEPRFKPHFDPSVSERENQKAVAVHQEMQRAIAHFEKLRAQPVKPRRRKGLGAPGGFPDGGF